MSLRRWGLLALLVAAALWLGLFAAHEVPPTPRGATCCSVEELARAPEGTRARCCELAGANRDSGGTGDWESGVSWGLANWTLAPPRKPACPCGCPSGERCPDVLPWMKPESDAAARCLGSPPVPGDGTAFCHGPRLGRCECSPVRATGQRQPAPRASGSPECLPLAEAVKAPEGEVLRICEWHGLNDRFGGTGDWELIVVHKDPDGLRWKTRDRPACPCGCQLGSGCAALASGRGLAAYCAGATGGCPRAPHAGRREVTPERSRAPSARPPPR